MNGKKNMGGIMNRYSIADPRFPLPAGTYYIGDPCYVIKDEEWMDALDSTNYFNLFPSSNQKKYNPKHMQNGVFLYHTNDFADDPVEQLNGIYWFACSSTEYGDGCYPCEDNEISIGECGVDAGLIAAIPIEMIVEHGDESCIDNGVRHTFDEPFFIAYEDEGKIIFGDVIVHTEDEDDGCY
jgi:hypothetical protein